ncbi:MAG: sulfatase [Verrucomicrobia bacterium]|nr:sulfatase [Verrucomicrobiota bacterium]
MKFLVKISLLLAVSVILALTGYAETKTAEQLPNVVIVFTDDQGYQDLGVFGAEGFETPNIDRMAKEGRIFTRWYAAQAVCSASRTAMLTGCYPNRVGIHGALGPRNTHGISGNEMTLADMFKQKGYATAIFGKWHLGHHPEFLPLRHGFDEYFGIPYSNDMWPKHPTAGDRFPPLPIIEGEKTLRFADEEDQTQMTTRLTERAVDFIHRNKEKPFFLYVPHPQPHVPLYVSDKFRGKTKRGLYGDVISEIDWSVGEILKALKEDGLDDKTLVIFTSDNGPWLNYGEHSGSALPLREGKGTAWEGGVREPCVMRWPGKIPAGTVCDEPGMNIDILPTLAGLIGAELPEHTIDGMDIWPMISGPIGTKNPHKGYWYYYKQNELHAVSMGKWKLYLPHSYRTLAGKPGGKGGTPVKYSQAKVQGLELYDLSSDISEALNVADQHPDLVKKMQNFAEEARAELGDKLKKRKGSGVRAPGKLTVAEKK